MNGATTAHRTLCARWSAIALLCAATSVAACTPAETDQARGAKPASIQSLSTVKLPAALKERAGIRIEPAARGPFRTFRDFHGVVKADDNRLAEITTLVRGRLVDVYKDLGDTVEAGEQMALLYSRELGLAQAAYLKAVAGLRVADQAFKRAKFLLDEKVIGQGEFQRREGQLTSARAEANEARNRLKLLGMTPQELSKLEREQAIRSQVPIVSPLAGRVIGRDVTKGEVVEISRHLFRVADLDTVWVIANVPEQDLSFIHRAIGQSSTAEVLLTAYPDEPLTGQVTYVGDVLDPDTRTMALRVEVPNPDGRLKPEMFATVRIWTPPVPDVMTVPSTALQRDRGETIVFVQLSDDEFSRRVVAVGERTGDHVKITDGLQEGERVVTAGAYVVKSELANQLHGGLAE